MKLKFKTRFHRLLKIWNRIPNNYVGVSEENYNIVLTSYIKQQKIEKCAMFLKGEKANYTHTHTKSVKI